MHIDKAKSGTDFSGLAEKREAYFFSPKAPLALPVRGFWSLGLLGF